MLVEKSEFHRKSSRWFSTVSCPGSTRECIGGRRLMRALDCQVNSTAMTICSLDAFRGPSGHPAQDCRGGLVRIVEVGQMTGAGDRPDFAAPGDWRGGTGRLA